MAMQKLARYQAMRDFGPTAEPLTAAIRKLGKV